MVQLFGESSELERFLDRPSTELAKVGLVIGHMPYGAHRRLPNPCRYLTVLRHPVDRVVSHYYFILRHQNNYLHEKVAKGGMSLEDFVGSGITWELDNLQTRLLGEGMHLELGQVDQDTLSQALTNLESLDMVGLVEEPYKTLVLLKKTLDWRSVPRVADVNVTKGRPKVSQVSSRARDIISHLNRHDLALYESARQLMESRFGALGILTRRQEGYYRALRQATTGSHLATITAYTQAVRHYFRKP